MKFDYKNKTWAHEAGEINPQLSQAIIETTPIFQRTLCRQKDWLMLSHQMDSSIFPLRQKDCSISKMMSEASGSMFLGRETGALDWWGIGTSTALLAGCLLSSQPWAPSLLFFLHRHIQRTHRSQSKLPSSRGKHPARASQTGLDHA